LMPPMMAVVRQHSVINGRLREAKLH